MARVLSERFIWSSLILAVILPSLHKTKPGSIHIDPGSFLIGICIWNKLISIPSTTNGVSFHKDARPMSWHVLRPTARPLFISNTEVFPKQSPKWLLLQLINHSFNNHSIQSFFIFKPQAIQSNLYKRPATVIFTQSVSLHNLFYKGGRTVQGEPRHITHSGIRHCWHGGNIKIVSRFVSYGIFA